MWLAGAGVKGGQAIGAIDDLGFDAVENRAHVADLHATILHLMGLDHTRLTDFHGGRDQRLTDVKGVVIEKALPDDEMSDLTQASRSSSLGERSHPEMTPNRRQFDTWVL
jgi:hypothetical protein